MKTIPDHTRKLSEKVLSDLIKMGCQEGKISSVLGQTVFFDCPDLRLKKADIPNFCRLIRQAGNLEHAGALQANIDRMGKVIGWHHSPNDDGTAYRKRST